jgi:hypothetical protein
VISACGRRRFHHDFGNAGSTLARIVRKFALKVWIACSAAFRQCMSGGTSRNLQLQVSLMAALYAELALLSNTWVVTAIPQSFRRFMMILYTGMRCLSCFVWNGWTRITLAPHITRQNYVLMTTLCVDREAAKVIRVERVQRHVEAMDLIGRW